ncbi:hypothetical protein DICVIV_03455 [Dictyocaulus viviparus]|uniref:Peptidase M12A domain-containing protein n=1 Tax=Dictyocaulus viviparus TaxID=29172 RepID=A0A0D8Y105_DICVI|nr:hypothetical protein DICVIV_03455 [Dictyocaulus viviparus]
MMTQNECLDELQEFGIVSHALISLKMIERNVLTTDKIVVINSTGCWSRVGKDGGDQTLSLGVGCESNVALARAHQDVKMVKFHIHETAQEVHTPTDMPRGTCGSTLTVNSTDQTLTVTMGDQYSTARKDEFEYCYYWLKAPVGQRVRVTLAEYSGVTVDGCKYGGVDIKTKMDKRYTGYRVFTTTSPTRISPTSTPCPVFPTLTRTPPSTTTTIPTTICGDSHPD